MVVAVKDSISGFVLYVKRCDSESEESIIDVLDAVKSGFGKPSGITCDMRTGIISAAGIVFPHTPIRTCLMHFLRDLEKDHMNVRRDTMQPVS
jgi:transposase-like protein